METKITIEQYRNQLNQQLQAYGLPRTSWDGIVEYILTGRPVGGFLYAVFSNDLATAACKADDLNIQRLRDYVHFLHACVPVGCFGSQSAVNAWMNTGGVIGAHKTASVE